MESPKLALEIARRILRAAPYGFLTTCGEDGPRARLVQHLLVEDDCSIWLATSPRSRKVADVRASPWPVVYAVEDRQAFAYVTVSGEPSLIDDDTRRRALWQDGLRAFFPGGPLGEDFILMRVAAHRLELMSFADAVHPDPYGLSALTLTRADTGWCTGASGGPHHRGARAHSCTRPIRCSACSDIG